MKGPSYVENMKNLLEKKYFASNAGPLKDELQLYLEFKKLTNNLKLKLSE